MMKNIRDSERECHPAGEKERGKGLKRSKARENKSKEEYGVWDEKVSEGRRRKQQV